MPPELVPKLRYYNVPARAEPGHKLHPWRLLAASPLKLTALDYVVVKRGAVYEMWRISQNRPSDGCSIAKSNLGLPQGSAILAQSA